MGKKSTMLALLLVALLALAACAPAEQETPAPVGYENGTYRGVFIDSGGVEVVVQFALENGAVTSTRYRLLSYGGNNYLDPEDENIEALAQQYDQVLSYLEGKDVQAHIGDLYTPGDFVDDVDGFSGATIRANKVRSAIQDGLNRGVYSQ